MKICVVDQHFYPEQFQINDICFQLAEDGHDVTVLTGLPNYPSGVIDNKYRWFKRRKENIKGVQVFRSWLIGRGTGNLRLSINYISFVISASIKSLFIKKDFDVIMVYQTSPVTMAIPGILLKLITKKPLIIYCLDLWPESISAVGISSKSYIYKILFKISKKIYNQADEIFISSEMFKEYFIDYLKVNKNITYLPAYADSVFENIDYLKENKDTIDLLFAGNIGKVQSVETIIYAANELKYKNNIRWHIVGDGSARKDCERIAKELNLNNVIFHGKHPITEMPKFYNMADAFLITLKNNKIISNTLPNKVQSYMASKRPIIGAVNGEAQRVINKAKCGMCAPAEDYKELANLVLEFCENKKMHLTYAKNARKYYEENFSKEKYMNKLEKLLYLICGKKGK